jgi:hypothetical protein
MKKIILGSLVVLFTATTSQAALFNFIWARDVNQIIKCFESDNVGQPVGLSLDNDRCAKSYAWGRDIYNQIKCFAVGAGGQELANSLSVDDSNCH